LAEDEAEVDMDEIINQEDYFPDYTLGVLQDLYKSDINVSISWVSINSITVKLGDRVRGVVVEGNLNAGIEVAVGWLRDKACELYPDSLFADKYRPPYVSPYVPGSPEARAIGCTCPPDQTPDEQGSYEVISKCIEHGYAVFREISGELVHVGSGWRPDRPAR
jgi:hypothetical protein